MTTKFSISSGEFSIFMLMPVHNCELKYWREGIVVHMLYCYLQVLLISLLYCYSESQPHQRCSVIFLRLHWQQKYGQLEGPFQFQWVCEPVIFIIIINIIIIIINLRPFPVFIYFFFLIFTSILNMPKKTLPFCTSPRLSQICSVCI